MCHYDDLHSPNTPSWRGAQLKHTDNFTFYLYKLREPFRVGNNAVNTSPRLTNTNPEDGSSNVFETLVSNRLAARTWS